MQCVRLALNTSSHLLGFAFAETLVADGAACLSARMRLLEPGFDRRIVRSPLRFLPAAAGGVSKSLASITASWRTQMSSLSLSAYFTWWVSFLASYETTVPRYHLHEQAT